MKNGATCIRKNHCESYTQHVPYLRTCSKYVFITPDNYLMLLIVDIMKRTDKLQPDHENLHHAICALEEVMT